MFKHFITLIILFGLFLSFLNAETIETTITGESKPFKTAPGIDTSDPMTSFEVSFYINKQSFIY